MEILGDTVNLAARMEQNGEPDRVQCTEAVRASAAKAFAFSAPRTLAIKGKGSVTSYFCTGARDLSGLSGLPEDV